MAAASNVAFYFHSAACWKPNKQETVGFLRTATPFCFLSTICTSALLFFPPHALISSSAVTSTASPGPLLATAHVNRGFRQERGNPGRRKSVRLLIRPGAGGVCCWSVALSHSLSVSVTRPLRLTEWARSAVLLLLPVTASGRMIWPSALLRGCLWTWQTTPSKKKQKKKAKRKDAPADYSQPIAIIPRALFRDNQPSSRHTSSHRWSACRLWRSRGEAPKTEDRKVHLKYIQGLAMIYPQLSTATHLKIADSRASTFIHPLLHFIGYYRGGRRTCQKRLGRIVVKAIWRTRCMQFILGSYASALDELAQLATLISGPFSSWL